MSAPDRACPDYPNDCMHPWAHARTYAEVKAAEGRRLRDDLAALSEASGDPEAFRVVYSALMSRYESSCRVGHLTQFADEVAALAVQALRGAGRLTATAATVQPCSEAVGSAEGDYP